MEHRAAGADLAAPVTDRVTAQSLAHIFAELASGMLPARTLTGNALLRIIS
jgi:hypothetical protein